MREPETRSPHPDSDLLEQALEHARSGLGTDADGERVWRQLRSRLGDASGASRSEPDSATTAGSAGTSAMAAKPWLVVIAVGALLGAGLFQESSEPATSPQGAAARNDVQRDVGTVAPSPIANEEPEVTSAPAAETAPVRALTPPQAATPARAGGSQRARRGNHPPPRHTDSVPQAGPDPMAEIGLIERAQQQLERQPTQALATLLEHAQRFPQGLLRQERESLRIEALSALGRHEEARERAQAFVAAFEVSPHRRRIEALIDREANSTPTSQSPSAAATHPTQHSANER